ncbi:uncharacterized protein B0H18DRAFT_41758 [Fomitopsis serialis]|uniref:uncharacterized protein n=1 Tax=Fomitopsis serialis TaxID=139415 RepID=UPI00200858E5|nr:uncharacterized protein B0H18DRAFT_41758 [Neoantrodia serialis]KAH9917278.1 hypothetical protein B0H18DRAFT_41758 [Neoantrodia serialis]
MSEFTNPRQPHAALVGLASPHDYLEIGTEESVIILSGSSQGYELELMCIRGVAQQAALSTPLYAWLHQVVESACNERRNPSHGGHMAQVGLNRGPWHARVVGWAKSYTRNLDPSIQQCHDEDVIGAVSLVWAMIKAVVPSEAIQEVEASLEQAEMPRIATRNVAEGSGYKITVGQQIYSFPAAERGPPEAYMSRGYIAWSHIDKAYCKFAFSLCVARELVTTRYNALPSGGANFVDVGLRVVIKQAAGTLIGFKADYSHGTTLAYGAVNHSISIAFSRPLAQAWKDSLLNKGVTSAPGAGEGNPDVELPQ